LLLKKLIKGEELFLDYGTGSGVLAIAALKVIKFILYFNP
jgi:ribosomal protein L11 methylase PrmA